MPELPEVEMARRVLARALAGATITSVVARDRLVVRGARAAEGARVVAIERRGKRLKVVLAAARGRSAAIFAHLGMTGHWESLAPGHPPLPYERARIAARRGRRTVAVAYVDPRRLGRVAFSRQDPPAWRTLGPDALDRTLRSSVLAEGLRGRRGSIKAALLDQRLLAGVGNIHAVEALWQARIDPRSHAAALSDRDVASLLRAVRASLSRGLRGHVRAGRAMYQQEGESHFRIYGRAGEPCPRCGHRLAKIVLAGRGTTFCPSCQVRR